MLTWSTCRSRNIGCDHNQKSDRSRFVRQDRSSPMKKNAFIRFYHRDAHYYVIISHNTSVPMIGHLELAIGTLRPTSHASWARARCLKICREFRFSQMPVSRSRFDYETFTRIIGFLIMKAAVVYMLFLGDQNFQRSTIGCLSNSSASCFNVSCCHVCTGDDLTVLDVDGSWSDWTSWSECSALCGGGSRSRHRACDSPASSGTGRDCDGHSQQLAHCNTHSCQVPILSSSLHLSLCLFVCLSVCVCLLSSLIRFSFHCYAQSSPGPGFTQPSILSVSVNEYRLRLGRYKADMCDAAWCAPCT